MLLVHLIYSCHFFFLFDSVEIVVQQLISRFFIALSNKESNGLYIDRYANPQKLLHPSNLKSIKSPKEYA